MWLCSSFVRSSVLVMMRLVQRSSWPRELVAVVFGSAVIRVASSTQHAQGSDRHRGGGHRCETGPKYLLRFNQGQFQIADAFKRDPGYICTDSTEFNNVSAALPATLLVCEYIVHCTYIAIRASHLSQTDIRLPRSHPCDQEDEHPQRQWQHQPHERAPV